MTDVEFRDWLEREVLGGRMTPRQRDDLLEQKMHFESDRDQIKRLYPQQVVGYVNGTREVGNTAQQLIASANRRYPGRMVYFEPVGFDLY